MTGPKKRSTVWEKLTTPIAIVCELTVAITAVVGVLVAMDIIKIPDDKTTTPSSTDTTTSNPNGGSKGSALIAVPNVVGLPKAEAERAILDAGLQPVVASAEPSRDVAKGSVLRSEPGAGDLVSDGSAIRLVISDGPPPPRPDLVLFLESRCDVIPGGALSGADVLNLYFRLRNEGDAPFNGPIRVVAQSNRGHTATLTSVRPSTSPASSPIQVDLAPQDYGQGLELTVIADEADDVDEHDEDNNRATITVPLPPTRPAGAIFPCS